MWTSYYKGPNLLNADGSYNGGFEYSVALALLGLLFLVFGGGVVSLDRVFRRKKPADRGRRADGAADASPTIGPHETTRSRSAPASEAARAGPGPQPPPARTPQGRRPRRPRPPGGRLGAADDRGDLGVARARRGGAAPPPTAAARAARRRPPAPRAPSPAAPGRRRLRRGGLGDVADAVQAPVRAPGRRRPPCRCATVTSQACRSVRRVEVRVGAQRGEERLLPGVVGVVGRAEHRTADAQHDRAVLAHDPVERRQPRHAATLARAARHDPGVRRTQRGPQSQETDRISTAQRHTAVRTCGHGPYRHRRRAPDPSGRHAHPRARRRRRVEPDRAAVDGHALRGLAGHHGQLRDDGGQGRPRGAAGRDRARHDAARLRRPRGHAPDPHRGPRRPRHLPHRQGRGRGPHRRADRRRRRLRHQALQPRGGHRPAAGPAAPQRRCLGAQRLDPRRRRPDPRRGQPRGEPRRHGDQR